MCLKVTNEEIDSQKRRKNYASSADAALHLNVDRPMCKTDKNYLKDSLLSNSRTKKDNLDERDFRLASTSKPVIDWSNPLERGGSSLGPTVAGPR